MAPGGLLDAGSRLTQTLIQVPFQREQFRAGLDEKALLREREDARIAKTDKINYLKDRISTTQSRIAELRRALMLGDKTEAAALLKGMNREGRVDGLSRGAQDAVNQALKSATDYEIDQRKQLITKVGQALSSQDEAGIKARTDKVRADALAEVRKEYPNEPWGGSGLLGGTSLKGIDVDMIKADPQLQVELDAALDQQSKLFEQYRELVGHAADEMDTRSFLYRAMPDVAPQGAQKPALGPPGTNPEDYQNIQAPPMVTLPYGGGSTDAMKGALPQLDDPSVLGQVGGNATPVQQDVLLQQQQQSLPQLNADVLNLQAGITGLQGAGAMPGETAALQSQLQTRQAAQQAATRNALTMEAFGVVTPETLAATDKILATLAPPGQTMLNQELAGREQWSQMTAADATTGPQGYPGPQVTPQILPRIRALAPPGMATPQQVAQQRQIRAGLSAQGLYGQ